MNLVMHMLLLQTMQLFSDYTMQSFLLLLLILNCLMLTSALLCDLKGPVADQMELS